MADFCDAKAKRPKRGQRGKASPPDLMELLMLAAGSSPAPALLPTDPLGALAPAVSANPQDELRRKYALEVAARLCMTSGAIAGPFGPVRVAQAETEVAPTDVVRLAREIDRFLRGD